MLLDVSLVLLGLVLNFFQLTDDIRDQSAKGCTDSNQSVVGQDTPKGNCAYGPSVHPGSWKNIDSYSNFWKRLRLSMLHIR